MQGAIQVLGFYQLLSTCDLGMIATTCHLRLASSLWVAWPVQAKFMATA